MLFNFLKEKVYTIYRRRLNIKDLRNVSLYVYVRVRVRVCMRYHSVHLKYNIIFQRIIFCLDNVITLNKYSKQM